MDVIEMSFQILLILDGVLPEAPLPDPALLPPPAGVGPATLLTASSEIPLGKLLFDAFPSNRKIGVAIRERPDGMYVIGQKHDGHDLKRPSGPNGFQSLPQTAARQRLGEEPAPFMRNDGEEKGPAGSQIQREHHR